MSHTYEKVLNELSKEQLIWIISQWKHLDFIVSDILVEESKCHLSKEDAINKIREQFFLIGVSIPHSYDIEQLKTELNYKMGKISTKECRKRLGLD